MNINCPITGLPIRVDAEVSVDEKGLTIRLNGVTIGEKYRLLYDCFLCWVRWIAENKPKYRDKQYYYDSYHNHINYESEGIFSFSIQTFDSPEGDRWWRGKFSLKFGEFKIIEEEN